MAPSSPILFAISSSFINVLFVFNSYVNALTHLLPILLLLRSICVNILFVFNAFANLNAPYNRLYYYIKC